ncbi:MAG: PadR family transcriptional regulator [Candidatus Hodarchaeota archaeon]
MAYLLLKCVELNEKSYGYQMKQFIESFINKQVAEGTLYPLLSKLADKSKYGYLESFIEGQSRRPRRYYTLTEKGRQQLIIWPKRWAQLKTILDGIITQANNIPSRSEAKRGD